VRRPPVMRRPKQPYIYKSFPISLTPKCESSFSSNLYFLPVKIGGLAVEGWFRREVRMPSHHSLSQIIPRDTGLFTEEDDHSKGSRPSCAAGQFPERSSRLLLLHIIAIFVLLFVSTFFITFPFLCNWFSKRVQSENDKGGGKRPWATMVSSTLKSFTWGARFFGTGVILGSAFIHVRQS